jgi:hypothetical protein
MILVAENILDFLFSFALHERSDWPPDYIVAVAIQHLLCGWVKGNPGGRASLGGWKRWD